jgi:hypothetical protein
MNPGEKRGETSKGKMTGNDCEYWQKMRGRSASFLASRKQQSGSLTPPYCHFCISEKSERWRERHAGGRRYVVVLPYLRSLGALEENQ